MVKNNFCTQHILVDWENFKGNADKHRRIRENIARETQERGSDSGAELEIHSSVK